MSECQACNLYKYLASAYTINRHLSMLHRGSKANRHIWGQYLEWRDPLYSEKMFFSLFPILLLGRRVEN